MSRLNGWKSERAFQGEEQHEQGPGGQAHREAHGQPHLASCIAGYTGKNAFVRQDGGECKTPENSKRQKK